MSCNPVRPQDFVYGFLEDAAKAEFEEHLADCDGCRSRVEALKREKDLLSEAGATVLERGDMRVHRVQSVTRLWGMLSVAASLAVCALVLWSIHRSADPNASMPAAPQDREEAKIRDLVQRLGSESPAERDASQAELIALGETAVPALQRARESEDAEIKARAAVALRRIANNGLKLEISTDKKSFAPDEMIKIAATFRNAGTLPVVVFKKSWFKLTAPGEMMNTDIDEVIHYELRAAGPDGKPFPIDSRQTLVMNRPGLPPQYTTEIAEADFVTLKGGESVELTRLTAQPTRPGSKGTALPAPHEVGMYEVSASYRFSPDGKPGNVTFVFLEKAQELWDNAFRGELKATEAEFEVAEPRK